MTVCIAAFAEKSKAIVLASDKAVTFDSVLPLQSDTAVRKILTIGRSGWKALIAGDPSFAQKVILHAKSRVPKEKSMKSQPFDLMMALMKDAYQEVRKQAVRDQILQPFLLTEELVVARRNQLLPLPDAFVETAVEGMRDYKAGCTMLVCGFSQNSSPHIFTVQEPGEVVIHDLSGYCAIGIGDNAAMQRLLWAEVSRRDSLDEVLYEVFDAKANAEIVQGVGYSWDAEVMVSAKHSQRVPHDVRRLIEDVWEQHARSPFDKKGKYPDRWKSRLGAFSRKVLSASL